MKDESESTCLIHPSTFRLPRRNFLFILPPSEVLSMTTGLVDPLAPGHPGQAAFLEESL